MDMQRKKTEIYRRCAVILTLCVFVFALELYAVSFDQDISSTSPGIISVPDVSTDFGGFKLEMNPDFSRITCLCAQLEDYQCGGITVTGRITAQSRGLWPIINDQFEADINLGIYKLVISGVFNNDHTKIFGKWDIYAAGSMCSGTWESP